MTPAATRAYLDHASTSPLRPAVLEAMLPYLRDHFADPSRLHREALVTRAAIEDAREQVAALLRATPREIVFTSGGTEACNAAVYSVLAARPGHVVLSAVEHSAVTEAVARAGVDHSTVGVDRAGRVDPGELAGRLRPDTTLVCLQLANHEVGTRQPVEAVGEIARQRGISVFADACAAVGHEPIDFGALGVDLLAATAHKLGGPKGAGALVIRRGLRLPPFVVGGSQERARRAGIENAPAIVGFGAAAAVLSGGALAREAAGQRALTYRITRAATAVPGVTRLGDPDTALPHIAALAVGGVEAEPVLLGLDQHGVAVHSGSSCSSEVLEPSPVLAAMGADADRSLRVSVGWSSTEGDADAFADAFAAVVGGLRALRT